MGVIMMHKQSNQQVKHMVIKYYMIIGVLFMLLLSMIYFTPRLVTNFQDKNFPQDLSLLEIDMPDTPGDYTQGMESIEDVLHSYNSYMRIEDTSNQTGLDKIVLISYIPDEFFNLGLPIDTRNYSHEFIDIELLKGEPIEQDNEIVISSTLAIELFDDVDVVGHTISYGDQTYIISGVMKDIPGYELLTSVDHIYTTTTLYYKGYIIFLDDGYKNSLYDIGGIELLSSVETTEQHDQMSQMIMDVSFYMVSIFIVMIGLIKYVVYKRIKTVLENESSNKIFIKQMIEFSVMICAIFCLAWVKLAATTTFYIAFHETFNIIKNYIWILNLYLIPIIIYFINNLDFIKRSEIIHTTKE